MKQPIFPIINALGTLALAVIVVTQWTQHERSRKEYRELEQHYYATEDARDEALLRAESLETDLAELKVALEATQKTAAEAVLAQQQQAEQFSAASATQNQLSAERDALKAQIANWEAAIKQRDETITTQNTTLTALRQKLDEAIARLKKAGAR